MEFIIGLITACSPFIAIWLRDYLQHRKVGDIYAYTEKYKKIKDILQGIVSQTKCTRVQLWEFHNGGKLYSGQSDQKASIRSEANAKGIYDVLPEFQNINISLLHRDLTVLKTQQYTYEPNEQQYDDAAGMIHRVMGNHSTYVFRINSNVKGKDGRYIPIALLLVAYSVPQMMDENNMNYVNSSLPILYKEITHIV